MSNTKNLKQNFDIPYSEDIQAVKTPLNFEISETQSLQNDLKKRNIKRPQNYYLAIIFAFSSAFGFAIHNYFVTYGIRMRNNSSSIAFAEFFSLMAAPIFLQMYLAGHSFKNKGKLWIKQESQLYDKSTLRFKYICLFCVISRGIISVFLNSNVGFMAYYSFRADISPSVIISINSLTSFTVAIVFYFLYHEKLNFKHLIGMILIIICVVLIAISKSFTIQRPLVEEPITVFVPIFFALLQVLVMTLSTVIIRKSQENGYDVIRFCIDQQIVSGGLFLLLFLHSHFTYLPYTWTQLWFIQIAVIAFTSAVIAFNYSLRYGKGGISMAICQLQNVFQLILEVLVEGRIPNYFEVSSIICALVGSIILAIAKK
ncbi:UNKNOWN [Stylonychia lemnae]|uniref:EamA domain-containing protein n=1 Tax=Stylonychia lemnae TaxID=5949 RepID=A0A078A5V1_STYLE|nr:UNKNOWN [Stylonychia lemnae]|eukprot:CDW77625.1 UNKNOWN [Stylonychia lemnae]